VAGPQLLCDILFRAQAVRCHVSHVTSCHVMPRHATSCHVMPSLTHARSSTRSGCASLPRRVTMPRHAVTHPLAHKTLNEHSSCRHSPTRSGCVRRQRGADPRSHAVPLRRRRPLLPFPIPCRCAPPPPHPLPPRRRAAPLTGYCCFGPARCTTPREAARLSPVERLNERVNKADERVSRSAAGAGTPPQQVVG